MEREKVYSHENDKGTKVYTYEYKFTKEEKERLEDELQNKASEKNIKKFIAWLEFYCQDIIRIKQYPERNLVKDNNERILKGCKKTLNDLKMIERSKVCFVTRKKIPNRNKPQDDKFNKMFLEIYNKTRCAVDVLVPLIKILEENLKEYKRTRGEKNKADNTELVFNIARKYKKYIGKPTTYKDGTFRAVVEIILDVLELPSTDPSRAIQSALKKLSI